MSASEPLVDHPRYQKLKNLNRGSFGVVQLAHDKETDRLVAIKFIRKNTTQVTKYVESELVNHRLLWHPHIIKFKEVFLTPQHLAIVLEYADGGDCYDYVVRNTSLSEQCARWIFQQLIVAVDYLHSMGVANRDIKLENTLLAGNPDRPIVKLCDFGYAKHEEMQSAPDSKVGTPAYLAPEIILASRGTNYDGKVADIWSCGVMLYAMLVGSYPFERPGDADVAPSKRLQHMIRRIVAVDYSLPESLALSDDCRDLLRQLLVADPRKRISLAGIQAHPWYRKNLPPGVATMNKKLRTNQCQQTEEEVRRIVREARASSDASSSAMRDSFDATVDTLATDGSSRLPCLPPA